MVSKLGATQAIEVATRGFTYVPSFLNESEVELLRHHYDALIVHQPNNSYFRCIPRDAYREICRKFEGWTENLREHAGVRVDRVYYGQYFANYQLKITSEGATPTRGDIFPWHQDHESYFAFQDHANYLNLYIPIVKPDPEQSNVSVIPLDSLRNRAAEVYERLLGRGATRLVETNRGWKLRDDEHGGTISKLHFDIREIEETPSLQAGDLLVLRGDVLHKTQDANTRRVAASFRMMNGQTTISRKQLARGGVAKTYVMYLGKEFYHAIFQYFDHVKSDLITVDGLSRHLESISDSHIPGKRMSSCGRTSFLLRLAREKLRALF